MDRKGQAAVLSAFVVVGMVFLVPAITEKALAVTRGEARGTCAGQPCEFTFLRRGLDAGQWFVPGGDPTGCCSPSTGPHKSPVSWTTHGKASSGFKEEGYVMYLVGAHRERTAHNWAEEGGSNENGYSAKMSFHNPALSLFASLGKNTCSVEIYNPNEQLQAAGKGPVTGSCQASQGNPSKIVYTLNSDFK